jgi:hypothetical protein
MTKHNTFGKGSKHRAVNGGNDAYYTDPEYAKKCCMIVRRETYRFKIDNIVEPSAGNASFLEGLKILSRKGSRNIYMYDINPKHELVVKNDFLKLTLEPNTIVIGNPPFGFNSSLAIKFFNQAASFNVKIIAFILPKTFKKDSVKNKLNKYYHLIYEEDCPKECFILSGNKYTVPCVFQIWRRAQNCRNDKIWDLENKWIEFTNQDDAEFSIRRVGGRAGNILPGDPKKYSPVSTYFCKERVNGAKKALEKIDFSDVVRSTSGVRSLSKREIHKKLFNYFNNENLKNGC